MRFASGYEADFVAPRDEAACVLDELAFRDLVSGRRRGWRAAVSRAGLTLLEPAYAFAVAWRNRRYERGRAAVRRVPVPVISVGNLTAGGTGKTPMVEWLARWFRARQVRVTLISRGYGAAAGARNDEALELEQKLPDVPHLLNADRVAAALTAVEKYACQLLLLDDAFQHRRIHRDLDLVLVDALEPFGFGRLLPRGLLREPLSSLARADVVGLTRCDLVDSPERARIWEVVRRHAPSALALEVAHRPQALLAWPDRQEDPLTLAGKSVAAFCGIGNPDGFRRTLLSCGYELVGFRRFADHHPYSREDLDSLARWSSQLKAEALLCTDKDLVKIQVAQLGDAPLRSLSIGMEILAGREPLESRLAALCDAALRGTTGQPLS